MAAEDLTSQSQTPRSAKVARASVWSPLSICTGAELSSWPHVASSFVLADICEDDGISISDRSFLRFLFLLGFENSSMVVRRTTVLKMNLLETFSEVGTWHRFLVFLLIEELFHEELSN
jgi:hypothetical protein